MPENDFEKNVKDKMDGFNLSPSADLWNKVEIKIRKDKKRRFIFWWPLALLLLGGGTGLAIWLTKDNSTNVPAPVSENNSEKLDINNKPVDKVVPDPENNLAVSGNEYPETSISLKESKLPVEVSSSTQSIAPEKTFVSLTKESGKTRKVLTVANKKPVELTSVVDNKNNEVAVTKIDSKESTMEKIAEEKTTAPVTEPVVEKAEEMKPVTVNKKVKLRPASQWGLGISAGSSGIIHKLGLGTNRDLFAAAPGGVAPPLANYHQPQRKRSFSFSAQAFYKHRLSSRLNLIGTAGYQFLSTRLLTGERVDSPLLINNYYSSNIRVGRIYRTPGYGKTGGYTNQFHFLSLGGELSWRFTNEKPNIRWNNGLSYERLIASSLLHYDGTTQVFYKDNKRLRKDHIFFNTSLSIPVGKKFELHPFVSQGLTSVYNKGDSAASRYSNYGLRVRYLFNKRK